MATADRVPPGEVAAKRNLCLLIQLRWLAVVGQLITIIVVHTVFNVTLPLVQMGSVVAFLIGLNFISLIRYYKQITLNNGGLFLELVLDVAALTIQLHLSGGATNPFVSLYLLQVIIGAVLLDAWSAWTLAIITSASFTWLTIFYRPLSFPHMHHTDTFNLHVHGMLLCFVLTAGLLVLFVSKINRNLRVRDEHLAELMQQATEEDHILRIGLLASGAAHELGTPLTTISVIVSDWRNLDAPTFNEAFAADLNELQLQVDRCKSIVDDILASAGTVRGDGTVRTTIGEFYEDIIADWASNNSQVDLSYSNQFHSSDLMISDRALKQSILNVLDNARDASPGWVGIDITRVKDTMVVVVDDCGNGFRADILSEFGRPYSSTKDREGSGLGLFLVVNVVRRLGGAVTAENRAGGGASVKISLPLESIGYGLSGEA